jgi:hypothetical protein
MLLVDRSSKDLLEVLRTTKKEIQVRSVYNRHITTLKNVNNLYILASAKPCAKIDYDIDFDPELDFVVIVDDYEDLIE